MWRVWLFQQVICIVSSLGDPMSFVVFCVRLRFFGV